MTTAGFLATITDMKKFFRMYNSFEEADRAELEYYKSMPPQEKFSLTEQLRIFKHGESFINADIPRVYKSFQR